MENTQFMNRIIKPITLEIDEACRYLGFLQKNREQFLQKGFFNKFIFENFVSYFRELAKAEATLWELVRKEFPESTGLDTGVDNKTVWWDLPEEK